MFYFIFIKCSTDTNHVHIESLYLIGYQYILYGQYAYSLLILHVILLICCTNSRTFKYIFHC